MQRVDCLALAVVCAAAGLFQAAFWNRPATKPIEQIQGGERVFVHDSQTASDFTLGGVLRMELLRPLLVA